MKASTLSLLLLAANASADGLAARPVRVHGKLDLDIYSSFDSAPEAPAPRALENWVPGDPRAERGQPGWVKHLSHAGYAGLGAAGLAASVASGGVAPAVGFGIVTLVQSYLEWRQARE